MTYTSQCGIQKSKWRQTSFSEVVETIQLFNQEKNTQLSIYEIILIRKMENEKFFIRGS